MSKDKICLEKGQLQNIVAAARDEEGSCPKAKEFIDDYLDMKKAPPKKQKKETDPTATKLLEKAIGRKINNLLNKISDFF